MSKKIAFPLAFLILTACFLSYKLGSAPGAHAAQAQPLPLPPATWTASSAPGEDGLATVTVPGQSGVQHVATCVSAVLLTYGSNYETTLYLRNGASGTGPVLQRWYLAAAPAYTSTIFSLCDLNIVGTAGNAMTLEFSSTGTLTYESVDLVGYDAS